MSIVIGRVIGRSPGLADLHLHVVLQTGASTNQAIDLHRTNPNPLTESRVVACAQSNLTNAVKGFVSDSGLWYSNWTPNLLRGGRSVTSSRW